MEQHSLRPRVAVLGAKNSAIPGIRNIKEYNFKRIWLISSSWAREGNLDAHTEAVRDWMQANYLLLDSIEFEGIFIDLYVRKSFFPKSWSEFLSEIDLMQPA